eukprot:CAMPEP_0178954200 /NCGR_PEP_ID=MMETSP0789-20121207/8854_1 /TAXON_ID=3005 /ORGANISM="Rhizosolenia setigera, Strain CCMP 1694" /LENGTH=341 /DNA_ID=CAMNT_0020635567 /DNA_START=495 /DNA_END=1520 /DNA_ORIENTATION=+
MKNVVGLNYNKQNFEEPEIFGHRGSLYKEPENTIASFLQAYEDGADGVELDVFYLPKCKNLIVFHGNGSDSNPGRLEGYCGVKGSILDYSLSEIRGEVTTASFSDDEEKSEETQQELAEPLQYEPSYEGLPCPKKKIIENGHIPTLEEVLVAVRDKIPHSKFVVRVELKGPGSEEPAFNLVKKLNMFHRVSFLSFNHSRIAKIRSLADKTNNEMNQSQSSSSNCGSISPTTIHTGALFAKDVPDNFIDLAKNVYGATQIHLRYDTCTKERIQQIHAANLGSVAWFRGPIAMKEDTDLVYKDVGNEDYKMYETVVKSGVKGMCVNRPEVLRNFLAERRNEEL